MFRIGDDNTGGFLVEAVAIEHPRERQYKWLPQQYMRDMKDGEFMLYIDEHLEALFQGDPELDQNTSMTSVEDKQGGYRDDGEDEIVLIRFKVEPKLFLESETIKKHRAKLSKQNT